MLKPIYKKFLLDFLEGNKENMINYIYESYISDDNFNPLYTYKEATEITDDIINLIKDIDEEWLIDIFL